MARFAKLDRQVERIEAALHRDRHVASNGTARNYTQSLSTYGKWLGEQGLRLENSTYALAKQYLDYRSEQVGQSALNADRQAINAYHGAFSQENASPLPIIKSEEVTALTSRRYTHEQMLEVCRHQSPAMQFATQLAYHSGVRAHELLTLEKGDHSDGRKWEVTRWAGADGNTYTVTGKGGLKRTVKIPYKLAEQLETLKLAAPRLVVDRGINYQQHYDLKGGNAVSSSFSKASKRALGWSRGFHGLRHSFAQNRYASLLQRTQSGEKALLGTSHALGHLRPEITRVYLR